MAINARFNEGASAPGGGDGRTYQISTPGIGAFGSDPMAAGDLIVLLAEGGSAGGGLSEPAITDNLGSAGWVKLADSGSFGPGVFRCTVWWKLCVGGETFVHGDWGATGTGRGLVGIFVRSPGALNEAYLIAAGPALFTGGGSLHLGPVHPSGNGEMYVGGTGIGPHTYSGASIDSPPGTHDNNGVTGNGFNNGSDGVAGIIHINDNVAANLASDNLTYTTSPLNDTWDFFVGIRTGATPTLDLAGTGRLLIAGTTPLDVTSGTPDADLAATGRLLVAGSAPLELTGGESVLTPAGGLVVSGAARIQVAPPFPPIPRPPPPVRLLGCGVYDCIIFDRGLRSIVGRIPFTQIAWSRVLDDTSDAHVTVDGVSNTGMKRDCCQLLGSLNPWQHEIGIYRTGRRVWSGPVTRVEFPSEQVVISALDLSGWLQVRDIHATHNHVQVDLANIWVAYVEDAMGVENSAGLYPVVEALTGILADRLVTNDMQTVAADAISELARTGLDWTCVDRLMRGSGVLTQPPAMPDATPIPTLIDESFAVAPTVTRDGGVMGNCWKVGGSGVGGVALAGEYGPAFAASDDHIARAAAPDYAAIEAQFGRIERQTNETKILDQASIDQNAATRYDLTKRPVDVISSGKLLPSAGITIDQLIPGALVNLHLARACVPIGDTYRLKQLDVTANNDGSEDVTGSWEPVGSVAAHEDL